MRAAASTLSVACLLMGCEAGSLTAPPPAVSIEPPVVTVSSAPAATPRIIACGGGVATTDPLFVVDGRIVTSHAELRLDPEDIESIEVVKGTAASAVFGSRASLGAVLITTRSRRPPAAR